MFKKVLKSIAGISVMLLIAGIFCMIPSFSKELLNQKSQAQTSVDNSLSVDNDNLTNADSVEISGNANANSSSISSITESWQNAIQNADTSVSLSKVTYNNKTVNGYTFYNLKNVYEINSAGQLALLAYYVNSGNTTYNSTNAVYILTASIDLGSKLWTPIGTSSKPFKASFIGAGYTISNVRVNDLTVENGTNNGAGLFGNVSGNISDLVLGGTYSIDTTTAHTYKGYLVGNLTGQVINCYTNGLSAPKLNAVGNGGTVYGGTTLNGKTETSYTSITGAGVMHSYYLNNGSFYIANSSMQQNWYNGDVYRMINGTTTTNNPIYTNAVPVLRENASEGQVYPLYVGNKANNLPTSKPTKKGITLIGFTPATITHTFNYGYGSRKAVKVTDIKYDQSFVEFFTERPQYQQRLGYDFSSLNGLNQAELNKEIFDDGYPVADETSDFAWTAQTGKNINLQLVTGVNSDGGSDTKDFTSLPEELIQNNINELKNASSGGFNGKNGEDGEYKATLSGITSGNTVSFKITILDGYSLQIDGNDLSVAFDGSSITATGKHDEENGYQTSGAQQDSYNLITGSHSCTSDNKGNKVYTITIANIVGNGGTLNIRVVRDSIKTELQIQMQKIGSEEFKSLPATLKANYSITNINNHSEDLIFTQVEDEEGLYVVPFSYKLKQVIEVNVSFTEENSWILSADASVGLSSKKPEPGNIEDYKGETFNNKYAKEITFTTDSISNTSPSYFKIVIGNAQTAVKIEYYKASNEASTQITSFKDEYSDIQTRINSSAYDKNELTGGQGVPGNIIDESSFIYVNMSNKNTGQADNFYVRTNGKYDLDKIEIYQGTNDTELVGTLTSKELYSSSNYTYTVSGNKIYLTNAFANNGTNYTVKIYLKEREHFFDDAKVTFRADGSDLYSDLGFFSPNFSDLFTLSISNTTTSSQTDYKNGNEISLTITLKEMARRIFYIDTNKFINIDESAYDVYTGGGYQKASTPNVQNDGNGVYTITFTAGTFDFDFIFNLTYKTIKGKVIGAKDSNKNDVSDSGIASDKYKFELKYNYNTTDNTCSLTAVSDFANISIFQQYYLLGWYLVNSEVVLEGNSNLSDKLGSEGGTLNSYYTSAAGFEFIYKHTSENKASFTFNLYAVLGNRTIQVEYDPGDELNGEINETNATFNSHKTGDSFIYNQDYLILNQVFLNLGNNVRGYTLTLLDAHGEKLEDFSLPITEILLNTTDTTDTENTKLNYSVLDWWKIWVDGAGNFSTDGLQSWTGLFNDSEENEEKDNDSIRKIKITYLWKPIQYKFKIDGQSVDSEYITIGSEITAEDDGSRKGIANYQIFVEDLSNVTLNRTSIEKPGYTAVSFNIYQKSEDIFFNWQFESENGYTLSISEFKRLINEAYWYENSNDCVINISTQRVGAHFKVYIEQSKENYYQLAWNEKGYPLTANEDGSKINE